MTLPPLVRALRPAQWTKNLFVLAPLLFGKVANRPDLVLTTLAAMVTFCGVASSLYLLNDVMDRDADLLHAVKRNRPIASGAISSRRALAVAGILFAAAVALAAVSARAALPWVLLYAVLTALYSLVLKKVQLLDVFIIASGFVLRVLAGSAPAAVAPSYWLLLCTFFLALFLALSKRRGELSARGSGGRPSLHLVPVGLIESFENVALGTTIVCYALYTVSPETMAWVCTRRLLLTVAIAVFRLFRWRL